MNRSLLLLALLITPTLVVLAQDGTLDPSFGSGAGFVAVQNVASIFFCAATAIQTDGKIVSAGTNNQIIRLNTNGSPDTSFGAAGTGVVTTLLSSISAILIQPDGSIVACGLASGNGALTRYTNAGIVDTNFGSNGVATAPVLSGGQLLSIVQQTDSKIVVGGFDSSGNNQVVRFNTNGTPDVTFATSPSPLADGVVGLVLQADGKIVALTGEFKNSTGFSPIYLVRYNTNGSVDTTFGVNGLATGPTIVATCLAIQSDGKFLVGGWGADIFIVVRFDTQGNLDTSFNGTGFNNTAVGSHCNAILLQADGAIVLAGANSPTTGGFLLWQLTRYTSAGIVDSSFGNGGTAVGPALGGTFADSVALQANGDIIVGASNTGGTNPFVARYLSSPALVVTRISSPNASTPVSVNTPTTFSGIAQDPSLVFLFIDNVLQPLGTHTDPNNWSITATVPTIGTHTARVVSVYQDGNLDIASDPITFAVGPQAPSSFTGTVTRNEFLNKTECVLQATFTPSSNPAVTQYIIAQNGIVLATIPATAPLQFVYCASCKGNAFNGITVSAATASGIIGAPQPLVIVS